MLESCSKRCAEQGLIAQLYNQSLKSLSLPKNYCQIFVAFGSFQLFSDRSEALQVLKNLRQHLLPAGRLIIETFVPWDEIKDTIEGDLLSDQSKAIPSERTAHSPDGSAIINRSQVTFHFKDQVEMCQTIYEKWADGQLILTEEEEYAFRWYYRYEMELFLEKAGFSNIQIIDASFEKNPQAVIYIAS
ncbi:MAG: hypothetical protein LLG04_04690 [Parachlamydia sp.]|nr:hypothetical protein [Parachlamydia sp.]